jgi:rhodanese-related sulfurtransferase
MPVPRIAKEELKDRLASTDQSVVPVVIDVRLKYPYEHSGLRIPGAMRMFPNAIDVARLPKGRLVVAYDSDPNEVVSTRVAAELRSGGYDVQVLKGGFPEWIGASFPVEPREGAAAPAAAPDTKG